MVRAVLTFLAIGLLGRLLVAAPTDERLRLISADIWEHTSRNGQAVDSLSGKVKLRKGEMELFTDWAVFYRGDARAHLSGSVVMVRLGELLTCDSLVFFDREDKIHAWGDTVRLKQEDKTITSREIVYWTELDSAIALHDVIMNQADRRVTADEFHYHKTGGQRGSSFWAEGAVEIIEGDRHVSGQRMTYDDTTGMLDLIGDAAIRESNRELRGNRIHLAYDGDDLRSGLVEEEARGTAQIKARLSAERRDLQSFTDELTSRRMEAGFVDNRLAYLNLLGMATSIYHVVEDSILQGMNHATGDTLTMDFDSTGQLVRIRVKGGARGRFEPEPGNTDVDTVVIYKAEYIDYQIPQEVTILERGARVDYQENGLAAGHIIVTWQDNLVRAGIAFQERPTLYQVGRDPMYGQLMEFDLVEEKGRVVRGRTKLEKGYYHGELVHRYPENVFYVRRSIYTTCELDTPHFYFASRRMKMLQGDKVIAKPIILYLMDIPLLGLPFVVFPNESGGRRTGWIMPNYGNSDLHGRYLEGLGYFWVINDYTDATSWLDFFDKRGIQARGRFRYNRRYKYSGQFSTTLFKQLVEGENKNIVNLFTGKTGNKWSGSWSHSQTIDPTQRLNVNARFTSDPRMFRDHGLDRRTRLNQQIVSSASYSKSWPGTSNRFSLALQEKYDLQAAGTPPDSPGQSKLEKSRTLPRISFGRASSALFKPARGQPPRWYHNFRWSLNSKLNNLQKVYLKAVLKDDSLGWSDKERIVDNRTWAKNSFNFQAQQNVLRYLTMSLNLGITQDWTPSYREAFFNTVTEATEYREVKAFIARHTGRISLSANTKLYGLLPLRIGSLQAVRHVITPSISYSYTPDFSKPILGYDLGYFPVGPEGAYDKFAGSPIGGTPQRESQSMSISVSNLFQAKREVEGEEVKTNLLTWNMGASYNFKADSLRLSPIRSSIRSPFLQKLNLDISMEHDFYEWDEAARRRVNRVRVIPRLARMSASTSLRLSGKRFIPIQEALPEDEEALVDTLQPEVEEEPEDAMSFRRGAVKPSIARDNLWEGTLALRYRLIPSLDPERRETFWLNGNFKLSIGPGWKVGYAARFDMLTQELVSHDVQLYRQLHCWEFSFSWTPSGSWRGFMLRINVIDMDLQDIKYESRGGQQSFLGIY